MTLTLSLIRREITGRYRGSALGVVWSLLTPLLMLAVYTLVFGVVLKSRWDIPGREGAAHSTAEFAVILFCGLIVFQYFSEVVTAAPGLVLANVNYVKKIVFPVHILPVVSAGAALFHAAVSMLVLLVFAAVVFGGLPSTVLLLPVAFAPLVVMGLGLTWILAALGVYFRDIGQLIGPLVTASMFLSPVLFQRSAMPEWLQPALLLNPLTIPVESVRAVTLFGQAPDWTALGLYSLAAIAVAFAGEAFFQATRRGFADVL
ncbi:MAG: ABC transporter permease [Rhizobiaceae bacterium]|nr:ABC transporter permease [Rhizobiaceae bacterium]